MSKAGICGGKKKDLDLEQILEEKVEACFRILNWTKLIFKSYEQLRERGLLVGNLIIY